jgi:predicted transcriptional regulator
MSQNVQLHIGTAEDMGRRFVDAWQRAEKGAVIDESHLTFPDLESILTTLTSKCLVLLRYIRQKGALSIKEVANALKRDYKNIHVDMAVLEKAGLLVKKDRKLSVPWSEVQASIAF